VTLAVLAMLVAPPKIALADTTTLICHMDKGLEVELGPTTIELNEARGTVVVNFGARHSANPDIPPTVGIWPAHSEEPHQATFSADTITWQVTYPVPNIPGVTWSSPPSPTTYNYTINRRTGVFNAIVNGQVDAHSYTCQAAQKQF